MKATNKHFIHKNAQPYLRSQIHAMVYRYLMGQNFDDNIEAFRQAVYFNWKSDKVNTQSFMFLCNFACWLENDKQFPEDEERVYQRFCDIMTEEMVEGGYFDDDDDEY